MGNQNANLKARDGVLFYEQDLSKVKRSPPKHIVEKAIVIDNVDSNENGEIKV